MPRTARVEYAGAVYHVMCRGDRREAIFGDDGDREMFLATLAEMCGRTGAAIHSYALMGNHYHLLLETPEPNLVAGMKWFQGTYTQRFNARHRVSGHLFQGRYKAVPVEAEEPEYFRRASDYIHLNPARAGLLDPRSPDLLAYGWSSFPQFVKATTLPAWLSRDRVFGAVGLPDQGAGSRRRYGASMAERVREILEATPSPEQARQWKELRRGWCLGSESFRDRLMDRIAQAVAGHKRASYRHEGMRRHDESQATVLLLRCLERLKLTQEELGRLRQIDPRKQAVAWRIKTASVVGDEWIGERLNMGHRSNVGRAVAAFRCPADLQRRQLKKRLLHVCAD